MQVPMITLNAQPVAAEAWAPFGWLPVADTNPADGDHTLNFEWADPHLNVIAHTYDEVEHTENGAVCDRMFRHATHTQALMPLNCDAIVAVAPAEIDFSDPGHIDAVRAFVLHPQDAFVLHRGTWHWGPFPLGSDPVQLLNVQGLRYAEDNDCVELAPVAGVVIEVVA
ncbi:MAG: ureidoglycolate lyase [Acidimicrobiia bacterium]